MPLALDPELRCKGVHEVEEPQVCPFCAQRDGGWKQSRPSDLPPGSFSREFAKWLFSAPKPQATSSKP